MNHLILKSNSSMSVGNKPIVLLPLDMYEKLTKNLCKLNFKSARNDIKKLKRDFLLVSSESSLSQDWLKSEEEKVWQNL